MTNRDGAGASLIGPPVQVGLIGVGDHTRQVLLPALQMIDAFHVVAAATARPETASAIRSRFGVPTSVGAESVLSRPDVEAVIIATPSSLHAALTVAALEAGKHVFCETPGVTSPDEVQRVEMARRRLGRTIMYGTCLRYAPIYRRLDAALAAARDSGGFVLTARYYPWLRHVYDLAASLLGDVATVTCLQPAGQTVTVLEFVSGDLALVHGGGPRNMGVPRELVEVSGRDLLLSARGARELWAYRDLEPCGVAEAAFDSAPATVWSPTASLPYGALTALTLRGYIPELEAFARAVRTGEATLSGLDQAERTLRIERAVARSLREGRNVATEPPLLGV